MNTTIISDDIISDVITSNDPAIRLTDNLNFLIRLSKSTIRDWYNHATITILEKMRETRPTEIHINHCIVGDDIGQELYHANLVDL